jgi:leucyl-tRNA---protein transferase
MPVTIERPDALTQAQLDHYLAHGWYRVGAVMMTRELAWFRGELRSTIWLRLPLWGFEFHKSQRRLMRRVERRFRVEVGACTVNAEREALYGRYIAHVEGERPGRLMSNLGGRHGRSLFTTLEVRIFDGDTLVGFSWFDLGKDSVESLIAVYDPDYASHSLGFFTMLAEVRHAQGLGLRYFYPGYVMPGDPAMDYKLRLRGQEYWEPRDLAWYPYRELGPTELPSERMFMALRRAELALSTVGVECRLRGYADFELGAWNPGVSGCMDQPVFLDCAPPNGVAVTWSLKTESFSVLRCYGAQVVARDDVGRVVPGSERQVVGVDAVLATVRTADQVARVVLGLRP